MRNDTNCFALSHHSRRHLFAQLCFQRGDILFGFILSGASFYLSYIQSRWSKKRLSMVPRRWKLASTCYLTLLDLLWHPCRLHGLSDSGKEKVTIWRVRSGSSVLAWSFRHWVLVCAFINSARLFSIFSSLLCKVFSIYFTNGHRVSSELYFLSSQALDWACCFMHPIRSLSGL